MMAAALFAATPGAAQVVAPSQLTPPSLRPPPAPPGGGLAVPGEPVLRPPPGAENLDVLIDDVTVEGGFAELAGRTAALVAGIKGRRVTVAAIYAFATALEQAYAAAGFVLARVAVPPQQIVDHDRLRLLVVDGFVEAVDVAALPGNVRDAVASRLAPLVERPHLTLAEIERRLLIAADVPGVSLRSTLVPGTREGGTRLVIEGSQRLVTGSLTADDRLPKSEGTWEFSGNVAANSPLGFGEQVYASFGLGADLGRVIAGTTPLRIYGGGVVVPLGPAGITVNPEYTHTTTQNLPTPAVPSAVGTFDRLALRLDGPLIRTRSRTLDLLVNLEHITQKSAVPSFDTDISLDRYTVVRIGPAFTTSLPWGASLQSGFTLSRGIGGRGGQQADAAGLPLSAIGASPNFNKAAASLRLSQPLPGALTLSLIAAGQSSLGKPMLRAEQFELDGEEAVSAYPAGSFSVDEGDTVRVELGRSFVWPLSAVSATLAPYVFGAGGHGHLVRATPVQQPVTTAGALGLGARGSLAQLGLGVGGSFAVELARQYSDQPGLRQGWRCNVIFGVTF